MNQVCVTKLFKFEAAHYLPGYEGPCKVMHGHSYKLEVTVSGNVDLDTSNLNAYDSMVLDFGELKKIVQKHIIEKFDHQLINEIVIEDSEGNPTIFPYPPTAEAMVVYFKDVITKYLPKDIGLVSIRLWETDTSYATIYCGGN